jgi:hypothetical protein
VDLYFIVAEQHASLEEIIAIAERKFRHEFNSRLFTEQLLFMDDVRDYDIDFLKTPVAAGASLLFSKIGYGNCRLPDSTRAKVTHVSAQFGLQLPRSSIHPTRTQPP